MRGRQQEDQQSGAGAVAQPCFTVATAALAISLLLLGPAHTPMQHALIQAPAAAAVALPSRLTTCSTLPPNACSSSTLHGPPHLLGAKAGAVGVHPILSTAIVGQDAGVERGEGLDGGHPSSQAQQQHQEHEPHGC